MYEFASGEGEQERIFDNQDAITKDIMKLGFIQYAIDDFYENNLGRTDLQSTKYPYQFSPSADVPHVMNSIEQHGKALSEIMSNNNWLRLFLGSTSVHVAAEEEKLVIFVRDSKSRNSLYYHLGVGIAQNTSREAFGDKPLTTTTQTYVGSQSINRLRLRLFNPMKSSSTATSNFLHK